MGGSGETNDDVVSVPDAVVVVVVSIGVIGIGEDVVSGLDTDAFNGVAEIGVKGHLEMEQRLWCFIVLLNGNSG